ncbi:Xaa--Pro dipeptidase [Rickenella mellea]|uniref:Xaa--Pro dipeptidase n=1 Tax=Rickenella mellea TaxID=50990 RepID=A0A4Y7Q4K2_9AGAM|nr:Xaa--Pro dipeptidase [Rickenella mellea]
MHTPTPEVTVTSGENKAPPHGSVAKSLRLKPWIKAHPTPVLLINAKVVNPRDGTIIHDAKVLVRDGNIEEVVAGQASFKCNTSRLREVDMKGMYICPGLVDCHVHVMAVPGVKSLGQIGLLPEQVVDLRSTYVLKDMLSRGFTTVRDTGGANAILAQSIEEGLVIGPRLIQCGQALSQTGGHGDMRPPWDTTTQTCCGGHQRGIAVTCDGVPQVLTAVRDEIRKGANFIKVMCGGGVASPTDLLESIQFTAEEIQAITTTCRQMGGIHSTAHAYSVEAIRHAIDNGILGIEHGNFIDAPTARLMAAKNIFLTPTLSCYEIMVRPPFEDSLPPSGKKKNAEVIRSGLEAIQIAEQEGVTVCYGSDLLLSMHALQTEEFSVRARVLPSPTILKHATTNAARLLRLEGKIGEIREGAFADLIVLNKNPLDDITILDNPEEHLYAVMKGGRVHFSRFEHLVVDQDTWP